MILVVTFGAVWIRDSFILKWTTFLNASLPWWFLYAGLIALNMSLAAVMIWIVAIVFLFSLCRYEEGLLLQRFGEDYSSYNSEVPMWIPSLTRRPRGNRQ